MNAKQYLTALQLLELSPYSRRTRELLGLSRSSCTRIAAGTQDVPAPVALLLGQYLEHGLPDSVESGADLTSP